MLAVWLPMCPTDGPMARIVGGDLPSDDTGQFKASTVTAVVPIFRVPPVLQSGEVEVPPTAVGACGRRFPVLKFAFFARFFAAAALSTSH